MRATVASPTLHLTVVTVIAAFGLCFWVSLVFKVEIVSKGHGKVIPAAKAQIIQSENIGRIKAIHVTNGDAVKAGQLLIEFDSTSPQAQLNLNTQRTARLLIEQSRFRSLLAGLNEPAKCGNESTVDAHFVKHHEHYPHIANEQLQLLRADCAEMQKRLALIESKIQVQLHAKSVIRASIERISALLIIQSERLEWSQALASRGTVSRADYLDVLETYTALEKQNVVYTQQLAQQTAQAFAISAERESYLFTLQKEHHQRVSDISATLAELEQTRTAAQKQVDTLKLYAPLAGIVTKSAAHTIGGVFDEGVAIMQIIPDDDLVGLEVMFSNNDIGFLEAGQSANIKLDAYPFERFGYLTGKVSRVSADSTEIQPQVWGFLVRVLPDSAYLVSGNTEHRLRPGMTANVDVITGERTLISYFFAPVIKTIHESLGEY
jgi:hemolysin D